MTRREQELTESRDIHRSSTFAGGAKAVFSVALFGSIGALAGHYLGRFGEDAAKSKHGMSSALGRWIGGIGLGALAGYVSLRSAAEEERARDTLAQKNATLEARVKTLEALQPQHLIHTDDSKHAGAVVSALSEKVL